MYLGIRKHPDPKEHDHQYSAAKCLKCGLCLEVCPNYLGAKDDFYGAEFANNAYLLHSSSLNRKRALEKQYEEHFCEAMFEITGMQRYLSGAPADVVIDFLYE